jgi:ABC-type nickel/cobalt efflux system permease component RcnA
VIGKAANDFDSHEQGGDYGGPFGAGFGAGMALAQKDMVPCPDAVIVRGRLMRMTMAVIMPMIMIMIMIVAMGVGMPMRMQSVVVRHAATLARYRRKVVKRWNPGSATERRRQPESPAARGGDS